MVDLSSSVTYRRVKELTHIDRVTVSRTLKTRTGDVFISLSSSWAESDLSSEKGMTLKEARVCADILALQAEVQALDHACKGGDITLDQFKARVLYVQQRYEASLKATVKDELKE